MAEPDRVRARPRRDRRLRPSQTHRGWTREGCGYIARLARSCWATGLYQQINLILLIAGLAAGPIVGSIFVERGDAPGARRRRAGRRPTSSRASRWRSTTRWRTAAPLAGGAGLFASRTTLAPEDRTTRRLERPAPRVFFPRVAGRRPAPGPLAGDRAPARGRYRFGPVDLVTRSPFGLLERRVTIEQPGSLIVYPTRRDR